VVGATTAVLFAPDRPREVVARLAHPDTRLVTLTVTGDAYADPPAPRAPGTPPVVWTDHLVDALAARRSAGLGGFTVLSCDNLAESGAAARRTVLTAAARHDETLARWVERNVTFPESMVDRITPGGGARTRALVSRRFGIDDRAPVLTEPFRQWVVQDSFCAGKPPLEDVGVHVVDDVSPHKLLKTSLLNGGHTAMAYVGMLAGHRTTADLVRDALLRAFVEELLRDEVAPHLPRVPGMPSGSYIDSVLERVANRDVADPLARLARRGSTKVPAYVLPSLARAAAGGGRAPLLSLAVAAWIHCLAGDGAVLDDARRGELRPLARRARVDPAPLLVAVDPTGPAAGDPRVRRQVRTALRDLEQGVQVAVRRALARAHQAGTADAPGRHTVPELGGDLIS